MMSVIDQGLPTSKKVHNQGSYKSFQNYNVPDGANVRWGQRQCILYIWILHTWHIRYSTSVICSFHWYCYMNEYPHNTKDCNEIKLLPFSCITEEANSARFLCYAWLIVIFSSTYFLMKLWVLLVFPRVPSSVLLLWYNLQFYFLHGYFLIVL